jgi:N-acetylglucosaminyl-diphospho-decaprenol L-rhamnosyltransferase
MFDLSIVVVSWNVRDLLHRCLASLAGAVRHLSCETFVVDNASGDGSAGMVRSEFPQVHLVENTENLGFTRANNQAIVRAEGRYILLLNPDTEVLGDALEEMVSFMDANPEAGVAGPQLVYADGSVQSSRRRFPDLKTLFVESTVLQRLFARSSIIKRYYVLDRPHDVVQDVDWVVGACLMTRRQAVEAAGLMDERFFMYSEEMDWCLRMKQKGWRVVYLPDARVMHHEARSSEQSPAAQHIYFQASKVAYAGKHFGRWQAEVLRMFLLTTYVYQMIEEGAKWLLGHRRALRAQRMAIYRQVVASGLRMPERKAYDGTNG